jgi:hypothetical protein
MTKYADELGKCYGKRGNLHIYKDRDMYAVFMVMKEFDFDANDNIIEGDRDEATLVGYIADITNKEHAFDLAQAEISSNAKMEVSA